jgi:hypothetical protein
MAVQPPPKFIGRITIEAGENDRVDWVETNGVTPVDKNTTLTPGTYYPTTILDALVVAMSAASSYGASYTYSVDNTTGIITLSASGGTLTGWRPKLTTSESDKLLTGGDVTQETSGDNHMGWHVDSAYPSYALEHASETASAYCWYPTEYCQTDDSRSEGVVSELNSLGGKQYVYNFSGNSTLGSTDYRHIRSVSFTYLPSADQAAWLADFWLPYAQFGNRFRFHRDRTSASYEEMTLTGDSLPNHTPARVSGYAWFTQGIQMRRYKA